MSSLVNSMRLGKSSFPRFTVVLMRCPAIVDMDSVLNFSKLLSLPGNGRVAAMGSCASHCKITPLLKVQ